LASLGFAPVACSGTVSEGEPKREPTCTTTVDPTTGVVSCDEGYVYRASSQRCQNGAIDDSSRGLPAITTTVDCSEDATVCDAFRFGECKTTSFQSLDKQCVSGCASDADCGVGNRCECYDGGKYGVCVTAYCDRDADCDAGYHCASSNQGCGSSPYRCQTAEDECFGTSDCPAGQECIDDGSGPRRCGSGPVCGRPFLVEDVARVAPTALRSDWHATTATPSLGGLSDAQRAAHAEHWTRMGQLEHASIAAFARFQLQLLALGAPPELVEQCTQALADETAHTRLCFDLASAYAGHAIGPGPLDVSNSLQLSSLLDVVDLVLAEGCFGETGAALEALEAARSASDPMLRATYERIAADEQRHAELAFRFVRWALERDAAGVGSRLHAALESDFAKSHPACDVARPCLSALLS
jgi:hypothetical protein